MSEDTLSENVRAVEELDLGKSRYFTALTDAGHLFSFDFGDGEWFRPVSTPSGAKDLVTTTPSGQRGLFVVTTDGSLVPFDFDRQSFGSALAEKWPANAASFALEGSRVVKLGSDGRVTDAASGAAVAGFPGHYTDMVNIPLYDAFEVAP
jgi:hypothetical protein